MKSLLRNIYLQQQFKPNYLLGIWINPYFIIRRGLFEGVVTISQKFAGGKLLDVGCGSKPYEDLFSVSEYWGIDVEMSGHDHLNSKIDKFYDGVEIPFLSAEFDWVFSSEVFEHVFNLDELLSEINRVLKTGGCLGFTCPFAWNEHEQPYDFARYTSFAIRHLMTKHGFEILYMKKTTSHFETLMQMLAAYVWQNCLPKFSPIRIVSSFVTVTPILFLGKILGHILPDDRSLFHNNVVIARKL